MYARPASIWFDNADMVDFPFYESFAFVNIWQSSFIDSFFTGAFFNRSSLNGMKSCTVYGVFFRFSSLLMFAIMQRTLAVLAHSERSLELLIMSSCLNVNSEGFTPTIPAHS